jgi:hypothetical protein
MRDTPENAKDLVCRFSHAWCRFSHDVSHSSSVCVCRLLYILICNGILQNENGLLSHCAFGDFPFFTCMSDFGGATLWHPCPNTQFFFSMDVHLSSQRLRTPIRRNKLSQARTHVFAVSITPLQCKRVCPLTSYLVPTNCSTPFWDPIGGKRICSSNTCQFEDNSQPIGVGLCTTGVPHSSSY